MNDRRREILEKREKREREYQEYVKNKKKLQFLIVKAI